MTYRISESQFTKIVLKEFGSKKFKEFLKKFDTLEGIKYAGTFENYLNTMFDGDLSRFSKESDIPLVKISKLQLEIHSLLIPFMNLPPSKYFGNPLGEFIVKQGGIQIKYQCYLSEPGRTSGYSHIIGISGDYGFGINHSKTNTIGERVRKKLFNQIIDKYDLSKYINENFN